MTPRAKCCGHTTSTNDPSESVPWLRDGGRPGHVPGLRSRSGDVLEVGVSPGSQRSHTQEAVPACAHPTTTITGLLPGREARTIGPLLRENPRPCCWPDGAGEPPRPPAEADTGLREGQLPRGRTAQRTPSPSLRQPRFRRACGLRQRLATGRTAGLQRDPILPNGAETKTCWPRLPGEGQSLPLPLPVLWKRLHFLQEIRLF